MKGSRMRHVGLFFLMVSCLCGCVATFPRRQDEPGPAISARVQDELQQVLDSLDADVDSLAKVLSGIGLAGGAAESAMAEVCRKHSCVFQCFAADADGRVAAVFPGSHGQQVGVSVKDLEHVKRLQAVAKPVMSEALRPFLGIPDVDIRWPVFDRKGVLIGSVGSLVKPAHFMGPVIQVDVEDMAWECRVIQKDGEMLYARDPAEIGRNLFSDPLYGAGPELGDLGRRIVAEPSGAGSYRFLRTQLGIPATREARWSTIGLHGTEWRVVLIRLK